MKKNLIIFIILLLTESLTLFAKPMSGVLGVALRSTVEETKVIMNENGWNLVAESSEEIQFKKNEGTWAKLDVDNIKFGIYENKVYRAIVNLPYDYANINELERALETVISTYELKQFDIIEQDDGTLARSVISYYDENKNQFDFVVLSLFGVTATSFWMIDTELNEKRTGENKIKEMNRIADDL